MTPMTSDGQHISREEVEQIANDAAAPFGWFWPKMARALLAADDALKEIRNTLIGEMLLTGETTKVVLGAVKLVEAAMLPREVKDATDS